MRREDKAVVDKKEIYKILEDSPILHLAMLDGDCPYLVPVNFGVLEGCIYIHSASEGKKIDLIRRNNRVAFQSETGLQIVHKSIPHKCGMLYESVAGIGKAVIVESVEDKKTGLQALMDHYNFENKPKWDFGECLDNVCIIKIEIESMTGKRSLPAHLD